MKTLYLGTLAGSRIYIHWSFWILAIFVFVSGLSHGVGFAAMQILLVFTFFFCVFLHELGHAVAARSFGIRTRDITLLPIGGIARIEGSNLTATAEGFIAVAGPAVNLLIAFSLLIGLSLSNIYERTSSGGFGELSFVEQLLLANLVLAIANMLPAFPLDGGRVLRSVLCKWWTKSDATQITSRIGLWIAGGLMLYCIYWWNISGFLMSAVLFAINYGHWLQARFLTMPDDLQEQIRRQMEQSEMEGDFEDDSNTIDAVEVRRIND